MKTALSLLLTVWLVLLPGCQTPPKPDTAIIRGPAVPCTGQLKRVTQLDLNTNQPIKTWNACSETIRQKTTPPIGINFVDAETGKKVQFQGTYRIQTFKAAR